jgi:hypothetical protein
MVPLNSLKRASSDCVGAAVLSVGGMRADAKIFTTVVKPVPVNVINIKSVRGGGNHAVHSDGLEFASNPDSSLCVSGTRLTVLPSVAVQCFKISIINYGGLSTGKENFFHG